MPSDRFNNILFRISRLPGHVWYNLGEHHKHGHGIHSPFMFRFISEVLEGRSEKNEFYKIEQLRKEIYKNRIRISNNNPGAGSSLYERQQESLGRKARNSSLNPATGRLLCRIIREFKPDLCIELGTSVGLGSMYMATALPNTTLITIEANPYLADFAQENFSKLEFNNICLQIGLFREQLRKMQNDAPKRLVVWLDGDHRGDALLGNINLLMTIAAPGSVIIVDDIRWSGFMNKAWKKLITDDRFPVTLDLWDMGILFFFNGLQKQHYLVKF